MKKIGTIRKATRLLSFAAASIFILVGRSSRDGTVPLPDITVSGVITDFDDEYK